MPLLFFALERTFEESSGEGKILGREGQRGAKNRRFVAKVKTLRADFAIPVFYLICLPGNHLEVLGQHR